MRQLITTAQSAADAVQDTPISANASHFRDIERVLLADLFAAVIRGGAAACASSCPNNRNLDRAVREALVFLRTQDGEDLHVEHLCRAIDVAERSLLRAFHRFFGVGPTQYLKLRRLNNVHCALHASRGKETTVTGILTTWGVTELGRFAGAYKALFGESPSETLKQRAGAKRYATSFADKSLNRRQARLTGAERVEDHNAEIQRIVADRQAGGRRGREDVLELAFAH